MRNWCSNKLAQVKDILRRLGPHRQDYIESIAPKDVVGRTRWLMDGSYSALSFPPAPCKWLCKRRLTRFHLTCLTCWLRRFHFKRRGYEKLKKHTRIVIVMRPPIGEYKILPEYYKTYGVFIPTDKYGRSNRIKEYIIKFLLTLTERIAEF